MNGTMRSRYLLPCLVLSGFAGLAYELLWVRLLAFSFGSTTLSYSTVLAVFFGGLALGAYLAGKRTATMQRPARAYALIELGTGICGLALYPVLTNLGSIFAAIDPGAGLGGAFVRALVATPLLLIPTVLMGATLPIVCRAMIVEDTDVGRGTALIYGINTIGACLGAYLTTYHLLPNFGVFQTTLITAVANFAVAAAVLGAERAGVDAPELSQSSSSSEGGESVPAKIVRVAIMLTFLGGFAAICFQVVWVRLFSIFLSGTIYAVGSVLISVLIGIGVGSVFISSFLKRSPRGALWLCGLQIGTIVSILVMVAMFPRISYWLRALEWPKSQGLTTLHLQLLGVFAVLSVPTFCSGASFPLLVEIVEKSASGAGKAVGRLYAANTVGSILGSLITGFVLLPGAGSEATILVALTLTAAVAAMAATLLGAKIPRVAGLAIAAVSLLLVGAYDGFDVKRLSVIVSQAPNYERAEQERDVQLRQLRFFSEGKVANVAVFEDKISRWLRLNGLGQGSLVNIPPRYALESLLVGLVPVMHKPKAQSALLVGLGAGVTVAAFHDLDLKRIKVLEIEPDVLPAVDIIFQGQSPAGLSGVDIELNDARHYMLLNTKKEERFDVIASMPAHPWVAANIFTQEFFELASKNLTPGGVFSTWFGVATWADDNISGSIFRAFTNVFDHYIIYFIAPTNSFFLVGANEPIDYDPKRIEGLLSHHVMRGREDMGDAVKVATWIHATGRGGAKAVREGPVNTDDSAYAEVFASRSSTGSPMAIGLLPHEYLQPSLVPEESRHDFFIDLLESLLGTPGGKLPLRAYPANLARAETTLASLVDVLSPDERKYFNARIQLLRRKFGPARAVLTDVGTRTSSIAARARRFVALTHPSGSRPRADALAQLPPSTDVIAALMELDERRALEMVPDVAVDVKKDPIGWLLWMAAHRANHPDLDLRDPLSLHVGKAVKNTKNHALLSSCIRVAQAAGLIAQSQSCRDWQRKLNEARANALLGEAMRANKRGDYATSVAKLTQANRLRPGNLRTGDLLMHAFARTGNVQGMEVLKRELVFSGMDPNWVDWLARSAQERAMKDRQKPRR